MECSVYCVIHKDSGAIYVGFTTRTVQHRWRDHVEDSKSRRGCRHFHNALAKYGKGQFYWQLFGVYQTITAALAAECELIWLIRDVGLQCYNLTSGGDHFKHSEESKLKMSKAKLGGTHSAEHRLKRSEAMKGRQFTNEHRRNLSIAMFGNASRTGKPHSDETRARIASSNLGKHQVTDETRAKMSAAAKRRRSK